MEDELRIKRIVFWQNILSHLLFPLIKEITKVNKFEICIVVPRLLTKEREKIGWEKQNTELVKIVVNPNENEVKKEIQRMPDKTLHVFSGISSYKFIGKAFKASLRINTKRAIISETYRFQGLMGYIRLLKGRFEAIRFGNEISIIYAIGENGCKWYRMCGYPDSKINKIKYYTEEKKKYHKVNERDCFVLTYIGQLIRRKGLDLLIKALKEIEIKNWELDIVGNGKEQKKIKEFVEEFGLGNKVNFKGSVKNSEINSYLNESDLLVLPSRWDGWGAVVNEALMAGVPVVCSSNCGAAELVYESGYGEVFKSSCWRMLKETIERQINKGKVDNKKRREIKEWSKKIVPAIGALEFVQTVKRIEKVVK